MRDVTIRLRLDINDLKAKAAIAGQQFRSFAKDLEKSAEKRQALNEIGGSFAKVGLAATAAGAIAARAFANFDEGMSSVAATGKDARDNIAGLRDLAVEMGAKTKFNATESAQAIEAMAKAGVSASDILGGGLKGAMDLAAAGGLDVASAAEIAATSMNQFGLAGEDVPHIADVLSAAAGKAMGDVTDMAQAFKYVGPVAKQMGISIEETGGTIAYLAQQGILGDQAGTSLRGMLTALTSPSKIAAKTMKDLGISMYDAKGEFIGFDGVAGQLQKQMKGLSNSERDAALGRIFGNEQITAARILYEGGEKAVRQWTKAVDDQGFAADTAAIKMDNLKGDVEQLTGSLETALIGTGEGADGPLRQLTQALTGLVDVYNDLPQPAKNAALGVAGVTAVLGTGTWAATKAISGYMDLKNNLNMLGASFGNANKKALAMRVGLGMAGVALMGLSRKAHDTDEGLGVLNDAASGALMGFAVGGPWGGAIGAGAGALYGLSKATDASSQSFDSGRASADEYAASMDGVTGAVTKATRAVVFDDLSKTNALRAASALGIANRDLIGYVLGEEGARKRVNAVLREQQQLMASGEGVMVELENGGRVDAYNALAQSLGLVGSEFEEGAAKAREATAATSTWKEALAGLPKNVQVELKNLNYEPTRMQVEDLRERYNLTPKQVRTILEATDLATPNITTVDDALDNLNKKGADPKVTVQTSGALQSISRVAFDLGNLRDREVNVTVKRHSVGGSFAEGGAIYGAGTGTSDSIPAMLSNGEHVLTAMEVRAMGGHDAVYRMRAAARVGALPRFADGGAVEAVSSLELTQMRIRVRDLQRSLRETEKYGKQKKTRYVLRGLDRLEARQELAEAKAELAEQQNIRKQIGKGKKYSSVGAYNQAQELASTRADAADSFMTGVDVDFSKSPAAIDRQLRKAAADWAVGMGLLIQLKKKGLAPWMLKQLQGAMPARGAIRYAQSLLADDAKFRSVNADVSSLNAIASDYARVTTDARWSANAAWSTSAASASTSGLQSQIAAAVESALSGLRVSAPVYLSNAQVATLVQAGQVEIGRRE